MEKNRTLYRNLKNIKGISNNWANKICTQLGVNHKIFYKDLSDHKLELLATILSNLKKSNKLIERNLEVEVKNNISKLISINAYRGKRISLGLPAHGQRTWSNGKIARKLNKRR